MADARLPPFDGNGDFTMWRMEGILQMEKLWNIVTEKWDDPTSEQRNIETNKLAYAQIMFCLIG